MFDSSDMGSITQWWCFVSALKEAEVQAELLLLLLRRHRRQLRLLQDERLYDDRQEEVRPGHLCVAALFSIVNSNNDD